MDYSLVLNILIIALQIIVIAVLVEISKQAKQMNAELDGNIAQAIQSVIQNSGVDFAEPINPIQAALAELLKNKIASASEPNPALTALRNADGKFTQQD